MPDAGGGARLFVLAGPDVARSFALGERNVLGRSAECDVVLRDRSISRKHALLVRQGEGWFVQDLGSANGVSKGGKRSERFDLADGDEFMLGDLPLRLRATSDADSQDIEFDSGPAAGAAPARGAALSPEARGDELVLAPAAEARIEAPPVAPVAPVRGADADVEVEIEEPDEIEIEGPDAPARGPVARSELAATVFRPPRAQRHTGFFSGDLEQQPFWMRCLVALFVIALGAGLAYGAYKAVLLLRSGL